MRLLALVAVTLAAGAAACAGTSAPPATLGAGALPGLDSRARTLDAAALAEDALEPAELAALLDGAGYAAGSEREFFGRTDTFDHVVARALRFESPDGAGAYLGWLAGHARDLLGRAGAEAPLPLGDAGLLFSLVACGTCKKELPTFLAAWRRGDTVRWLLAAGRGASRHTVEALARVLDTAGTEH